jgi:dienelactone hydrolase
MTIPVLILIGQQDDLTPARFCQDLAQGYANGPNDENIRLVVFPNAYHAFDNPSFPSPTAFLGSWLEYDPEAAARSAREIKEFLYRCVDAGGKDDTAPAATAASRRSCL